MLVHDIYSRVVVDNVVCSRILVLVVLVTKMTIVSRQGLLCRCGYDTTPRCSRRQAGFGFARRTAMVSAARENGPHFSQKETYEKEMRFACEPAGGGHQAMSLGKDERGVISQHQGLNALVEQSADGVRLLEGSEAVDVLMPCVMMHANIEDMLTG